jgi:hypothetical protein
MTEKLILLLIGSIVLIGCSDDKAALNRLAQPKVELDYRRIISQQFLLDHGTDRFDQDAGKVFVNRSNLGALEISGLRWVQHNTATARVGLVCLRAHPAGLPSIDLSIFIDGGKIVDARTSIIIDDCDRQSYQPFTPGPPSQ